MAAVNYEYVYAFPSLLEAVADGRRLTLATCGGVEKHPYFFQGRFMQPRRCADMLLTISEISRTRFYSPTEIRERMLAAADPVVTSGGDRLRFEAFSVCCGAYARVDLRPEAVDGDYISRGTTNVDFNPPMRAALTSILNTERVGLNVGANSVELERGAGKVIERKVKLPVRWLKGFVEVQAYQPKMKPVFEICADEARRFFRTLPTHSITSKGNVMYVVAAGKGLRLSTREAPNAVLLGAPGRLKVLDPLLRHAKLLRVYGGPEGVSGWEVVLDDASFHLVLSPDASRGFSGQGQVLSQLAKGRGGDALAGVKATLKWQSRMEPNVLARQLQVDTEVISDALAMLGTRGLVGYDLADGAFFHRELPFDMQLVEELQPRLLNARKMVEEKAVRIVKRTGERVEAYVKGSEVEHRVVIDGDEANCTCTWNVKHSGERGACRHILALEISISDQDNGKNN